MNVCIKLLIFALLLVGFGLLFRQFNCREAFAGALRRTAAGMEDAWRKRVLENRRKLHFMQEEETCLYRIERELTYSGWRRRFPFLTAEVWLAGNVVLLSVVFTGGYLLTESWVFSLGMLFCIVLTEYFALRIGKNGEDRAVSENLLELLNFLGSYSVTAGEITGVFGQISKYVEEPLRSALDDCCYEAQTSGDSALALLGMAEKISHPMFKELVHNMEVSVRYSADFKALVHTSRRSVREYLRLKEERTGMLREAMINMAILFILSVFSLLVVDGLIEPSIWEILFDSVPGWIALGIAGLIFLLLGRRALRTAD